MHFLKTRTELVRPLALVIPERVGASSHATRKR